MLLGDKEIGVFEAIIREMRERHNVVIYLTNHRDVSEMGIPKDN